MGKARCLHNRLSNRYARLRLMDHWSDFAKLRYTLSIYEMGPRSGFARKFYC